MELFDFSHLPTTLERLLLNHNRIYDLVNFETISRLYRLNTLRLDSNRLVDIDFNSLPANIATLHIENNKISFINYCHTPAYGEYNLNLHTLHMENNSFTTIDFRCLPPRLQQLSIHNNKITSIGGCEALRQLTRNEPGLTTIDFHNNRLVHFELTCLSHNVRSINLNDNVITRFDDDELHNLPNLRFLNLHGNMLTQFNFGLGASDGAQCIGCALRWLDLSNNHMTSITNTGHLRHYGALTHLNLAHNQLWYSPLGDVPPSIQELSLHHNQLNFTGSLPDSDVYPRLLKKVEFHNNNFTSISAYHIPRNIVNLTLHNNKITEIHDCHDLQTRAQHLTHLTLHDNKLKTFSLNCLPKSIVDLTLNNNKLERLDGCTNGAPKLTNLANINMVENSINFFDFNCLSKLGLNGDGFVIDPETNKISIIDGDSDEHYDFDSVQGRHSQRRKFEIEF